MWPDNELAQYGLGQIFIYRKEPNKAISCFEKVLEKSPENVEALRV
jgi:hypothetical protein